MTVEQFQELPLDEGPLLHELHHGEIVAFAGPKDNHYRLQKRLERLLEARAGDLGVVGMEMPFRGGLSARCRGVQIELPQCLGSP